LGEGMGPELAMRKAAEELEDNFLIDERVTPWLGGGGDVSNLIFFPEGTTAMKANYPGFVENPGETFNFLAERYLENIVPYLSVEEGKRAGAGKLRQSIDMDINEGNVEETAARLTAERKERMPLPEWVQAQMANPLITTPDGWKGVRYGVPEEHPAYQDWLEAMEVDPRRLLATFGDMNIRRPEDIAIERDIATGDYILVDRENRLPLPTDMGGVEGVFKVRFKAEEVHKLSKQFRELEAAEADKDDIHVPGRYAETGRLGLKPALQSKKSLKNAQDKIDKATALAEALHNWNRFDQEDLYRLGLLKTDEEIKAKLANIKEREMAIPFDGVPTKDKK